MCTLCQALNPSITNLDSHTDGTLSSGSIAGDVPQSDTGGDGSGLPTYSSAQIGDYLTNGYWEDTGRSARSYDVSTGDTITVNFSGLSSSARATAQDALDAWTAVSGLNFAQSSTAQITFTESRSGAYASSSTIGGRILSTTINIDDAWASYGDYYLQTYIHEIGHALGLGHSGDYNGSANFSRDAHFANDSWQTTVMSYFDQNENTNTNASRVFLATAMLGDIAAIQSIYGRPTNVRTGDTVYGDGENTGQFGMDLPSSHAVAIYDNGGTDHINLASRSADQRLDLRGETYSDLNGRVGNFSIAGDTIIENATTGSGDDHITGNDAANQLNGGAGDDTLLGGVGDDILTGGSGADTLTGGSGADRFVFTALSDAGDTITDLTLGDGDVIDVSALLAAIGYTGDDPEADGILSLEAATGGSYLVVDPDGAGGSAGTRLAFLEGRSATTPISSLLGSGGSAPADPEPTPEDPDPTPSGSVDTIHAVTDAFVTNWTEENSIIADTDGGTDTLDLTAVSHATRIYLDSSTTGRIYRSDIAVADGTEIENLLLGSGRDRGYGNDLENTIDGGADNDRLYGQGGDDTLLGGTGNDALYGGDGVDELDGGLGNDKLYGGDGDDILTEADGNDKLYGGAGDDVLTGGVGDDYLRGDDGADSLTGGVGNDKLYGRNGEDILTGGDGDDYLNGGYDADQLTGGNGMDRLSGDRGDDVLYGGNGKDRVKGGNDNDIVYGNDGDDRVCGDRGNDIVYGNAGNDRVEGGSGDDVLYGGAGVDLLKGGSGADRFVFETGDDFGDTIMDFRLNYGDRLDVSDLLEAAGVTVGEALEAGLFTMTIEGRGSWMSFDADGEGGAAAIQLAYLSRIDDPVELTADWFA